MRILRGAEGLLKNCKCRIRWYKADKPFLPPNEVCERIRKAIEARSERLMHLIRLRQEHAWKPEAPALEIICRARTSGSAPLRDKSKEPKVEGSNAQPGLTNQSLHKGPPKCPPENVKQEPQIELDRANSDNLEIFKCKPCTEDGSGEDLGTSDLKIQQGKNRGPNQSVLKKESPKSAEPSKQPAKPPVSAAPKEKPQQSGKSGIIEQGSKAPASIQQGKNRGPNESVLKKESPNNAEPSKQPAKPPVSAALKEKPQPSGKSGIIEQGSKAPTSPPPEVRKTVPQRESPVQDKLAKPQVKPSAKGAQEKAKAGDSQSKKSPQNLTNKETIPSASPFPRGRNPCIDGKRSDGWKTKNAAPKQNSCGKENVKVEEKTKDSCKKQEFKECKQKKQEVVAELKEQKTKPANTPVKKDTHPKAEEKNNKSRMKEFEEKKKPMKQGQINPEIYKSKAKSQVKPLQDAVAEPKKQTVKDDPPKAAPQSQTDHEWKQPPLPTSNFSFPLLSAYPKGRNPCRDGPRNGSEKQLKAKGKECKAENKLDMDPKEERIETSPRKDVGGEPCPKIASPTCLKTSESVAMESVKKAVKDSESQTASKSVTNKEGSKKACKEFEINTEPEEDERIETCPKKDIQIEICLNDALKKPKAKANEISDVAKCGKPPKTTKETKLTSDCPNLQICFKPSESVKDCASKSVSNKEELSEVLKKIITEAQKAVELVSCKEESKKASKGVIIETQKASKSVPRKEEKKEASNEVITETQKASNTVPRKEELKEALNEVITETQKALKSVPRKEELKEAPNEVITKTQKASQSISNKEVSMKPEKKIPPTGADTSKEPKQSLELKNFPAAPLKRTLSAYLDSIEPLLTAKEFKKEVKLAEEFESGEGTKLQELLQSEADGSSNWLTPRWTQATYLAYQAPVTAFTSPALSFPVQKFEDPTDCLLFTARAIRAIYEFKKLVDEDKIPVATMGGNALDNSQFVNIFGTVRKPGRFCDTIEQCRDSDYVVVAYRNNYFQLPILSSSGNLLSVTSLIDELNAIIEFPLARGVPYGLLTHDKRDNWAEAYGALYCLPGNADTLKAIEQSQFLVCLDRDVPVPKGQEYVVQAHQLLHGGGIKQNSGNRWMDKTIQLIVNPNGLAGFCYEHSPAECQPLAMLMDYVVEKIECESKSESESESESKETNNGGNSNPARHLRFHPMDECINMWLHVAMRNIKKIVRQLQMNVFEYECHGREFIKAQGLNSDGYIQMALQLAYYNMHQTLPAQYESAHLRMFVDGRTETIRSTSNDSKAFVLAMTCENASQTEKVKALYKAVDFHEQLTKLALNGEGIDRHLFGLQEMARENALPMPEFFKSKGFVRSVTFQLYTSQVSTSHNAFMAYGPLTCDGYGCCYNPKDNKITFAISGWQTPDLRVNPEAYGKAIKKSLDTMRRLILTSGGERVGENPCACELI